jgi:inner membrane protein
MDPLSQAAVGAAVGHLFFHRQLGMKAAGLGALAGMFPDVDTFYGAMEGPFARLESHRGVTHSLFFGPVAGTAFGWWYGRRLARRTPPGAAPPPGPAVWCGLFALALLSHPLLDLFTHYGTQLLAPFSRTRFALPAVPVVDPVFTAVLGLGLLLAAVLNRRKPAGVSPALASGIALGLAGLYLAAGLAINARAELEARQQLAAAGVQAEQVHAFPTMLQLPYRRLVALSEDEVRVGYVSVWQPCRINWSVAPRLRDPRLDALARTEEGRVFSWFAAGLLGQRISPEADEDLVEISDLRYGFEPDARSGLWGIRARFDGAGTRLDAPEYFRNRPRISGDNISLLWSVAFPDNCRPGRPVSFAASD